VLDHGNEIYEDVKPSTLHPGEGFELTIEKDNPVMSISSTSVVVHLYVCTYVGRKLLFFSKNEKEETTSKARLFFVLSVIARYEPG
jgi:hypothetical protein